MNSNIWQRSSVGSVSILGGSIDRLSVLQQRGSNPLLEATNWSGPRGEIQSPFLG